MSHEAGPRLAGNSPKFLGWAGLERGQGGLFLEVWEADGGALDLGRSDHGARMRAMRIFFVVMLLLSSASGLYRDGFEVSESSCDGALLP